MPEWSRTPLAHLGAVIIIMALVVTWAPAALVAETPVPSAATPSIRVSPVSLTFDLREVVTPSMAAAAETNSVVGVETLGTGAAELAVRVTVPDPSDAGLSLDGEGWLNAVGKPLLPAVSRWVALPDGATAELDVRAVEFSVQRGWYVEPAQEPPPYAPEIERVLACDKAVYATDAYYPVELADLGKPISVRGQRLALLRVYPYRWNPVTGELAVATKIDVMVTFDGASGLKAISQRASLDLRDIVLNSDVVAASDAAPGLLIVSHTGFVTAAQTLADFRTRQGFDVAVRTTDAISTTAQGIAAYIQHAYDAWMPNLAYVLLLGDAEHIPMHYGEMHPKDGVFVATDLYYGTVDGDDVYPDLGVGRISVDTLDDAQGAVARIIAYESEPVTDPLFYERAVGVAYYQDWEEPYGYEDRRFVRTAEEVRDGLLDEGVDVQRVYYAKDEVTPQFYNNDIHGDGEPLPDELLRANGFAWDGDGADITAAVNTGALLVFARGHGAFNGWGNPVFKTEDVLALENGNRLPLVLSINCQTGWLDNETDDPDLGAPNDYVCFAEAWLRNPAGGAVGVVAATRTSYSGYNDTLLLGMADALWPTFLASTYGDIADGPARIGDALNLAKLHMATQWSDEENFVVEMEEFVYLGDPTTRLWTTMPPLREQSVKVANDGTADLVISSMNKQYGAPWLTITATLPMTISPGGSQDILVGVDGQGLDESSYSERILITCSDPYVAPYPDGVNVTLLRGDDAAEHRLWLPLITQ